MPNYDNAEMQTGGGSASADIIKELKVIALLLRQGLNIPDTEDNSLFSQTLPTIPPTTTNP